MTTQENLSNPYIPALIAAFISICGVFVSYIVNNKQLRQQEANILKQLQRPMTEKLYELRLKIYPKAFEITEKIKPERKPKFINTKEEVHEIYQELILWKNGEASIVLSNQSLYLFGELCKKLHKIPSPKSEYYSSVQAENILKAKADFRKSLRKDMNFLYNEDLSDIQNG